MKAFQRLEDLARQHGLVYELGGGQPGRASLTARKRFASGRGSRKWLVAEGEDFEAAATSLAQQIETATS